MAKLSFSFPNAEEAVKAKAQRDTATACVPLHLRPQDLLGKQTLLESEQLPKVRVIFPKNIYDLVTDFENLQVQMGKRYDENMKTNVQLNSEECCGANQMYWGSSKKGGQLWDEGLRWEEGRCSDGQDLDRSSSFNTNLLGILRQVI